jgi:hypothetical protein
LFGLNLNILDDKKICQIYLTRPPTHLYKSEIMWLEAYFTELTSTSSAKGRHGSASVGRGVTLVSRASSPYSYNHHLRVVLILSSMTIINLIERLLFLNLLLNFFFLGCNNG